MKRDSYYIGTPITLSIRLSEDMDKRIRKEAKQFKVHRSQVIRAALNHYFGVATPGRGREPRGKS